VLTRCFEEGKFAGRGFGNQKKQDEISMAENGERG
jgi:hypothetical protein